MVWRLIAIGLREVASVNIWKETPFMKMQADATERYAARRRGVVKAVAKAHKVDVLLITNATDVRYLTGCCEGAQALLFGRDWAIIFTGKMFEHAIPEQAPGVDVRVVDKVVHAAAAAALREKKHRRAIGFQGSHMSWAQHQAWSKGLGRRKLVSIQGAVVDYRAVKDEKEIRLIRKCVRIAEKAFLELVGRGLGYLVGQTEKTLATELEYLMRGMGADRQGFPMNGIIVASGPNSASCHHQPTTRKIRRNEPLLFDWGAELDGYRSDITRTIFTGSVPGRFEEIYNLVLKANEAGVAVLKPGVRCQTVAKSAWGVIRDAGYGETIRHGLGHGLGLDVHEQPGFGNGLTLRDGKNPVLRKGMVVTIEPGIYYKGEGGVRIEDDLLVTAKGRTRLTRLTRKLADLVIL